MTRQHSGRATIKDVARQAGVSIATISRVINGMEVVTPETARRVQEVIDRLGYRPHAVARHLALQRTTTLGLMISEIGGAFFAPLLRGLEQGARQAGYDLLIYTTHRSQVPAPSLPRPLSEYNTDGLLIFTDALEDQEILRLSGRGFPVVLLQRTPPAGSQVACITLENQSGAECIVSHLVENHQRRRIAFLVGPEGNEDSAERFTGYRTALAAHDLPFDPGLVGPGGYQRSIAAATVAGWITGGLDFDAVFASDDDSAMGAIDVLQAVGRHVPGKVSVAGFDDQEWARYSNPPLTTVRAPTEQLGMEAVRLLDRVIQADFDSPLIRLPVEVVIRKSCGC